MKALEAERNNLNDSDYNEAYKIIYGTKVDAYEKKLILGNPGIKIPEYKYDSEMWKKIRSFSDK